MSCFFDEFDDSKKTKNNDEFIINQNIKPQKTLKITDWLNSINFNKDYLMTKDNENKYPQYVINSILSKSNDLVLYIEALNNMNISNKQHYDFLLNAIPSKKRFIPFYNKKEKNIEGIELVKRYYKINYKRAAKYFELLDEDDVNNLVKYYDEGGINGKK